MRMLSGSVIILAGSICAAAAILTKGHANQTNGAWLPLTVTPLY
jgi:hypothetical protein